MADLQHDLAALVHRFRRLTVPGSNDWDLPGIRAAIEKCDAPPCEVAAAAFSLAARPDMKTPALLPQAGSWWNKGDGMTGPRVRMTQPCPEHPDHDMPHDHGADPPEKVAAGIEAAKAALRTAPKYVPPAVKRAQALEAK